MTSTPDKNNNKSLLPPYLRPAASRTHSNTSVNSKSSSRSRARPQNDYIPAAGGAAEIVGGVDGTIVTDFETRQLLSENDGEDEEEEEEDDEDADWEAAREGSIARRSKWRRPRPAWIYPFVIGTTLTVGMGGAPKSELYVNLACLVHPPRQPTSVTNAFEAVSTRPEVQMYQPWTGYADSSINASLPQPDVPVPHKPLSAADKWFLKLQKDIYDYRHSHEMSPKPSPTMTITHSRPSATGTSPSEPLPHPTSPADDGDRRDDEPRKGDAPFHAIDPTLCKKDPQVQAIAAQLVMVLSVTLGILSALSAGFWGKTSDRIGRKKIMAIVELGLLIGEINFILVASFPHLAPGGYRALLIGPTVDGLLGGFTTLLGTAHAYVSDVTPNGSRAAAFSRLAGAVMFGFACGPVIGALLIRATDNIMVPFYVNAVVHAIWPILILFILPESLSTEARAHLAKQAAIKAEDQKRKDQLQREWESEEDVAEPGASGWSRISNATGSRRGKRISGNIRRFLKKMFHFLEPLTIFAPQERTDGKRGKNWNLVLIGFAVFCTSMNYGVMQVKVQYTFYAYGWTTAQLGPFMSTAGFSRGAVLLGLIPLATRYVKPYFVRRAAANASSEPEEHEAAVAASAALGASRFDLFVARCSYVVETLGLAILSFNVHPIAFVAVTVLMTLGSGSPPALNSLAMTMLPNKRESGRLFGALSVLHALGMTLISPLLFGTVFAATVGSYAPTVFILAGGILALAFVALLFVKLEDGSVGDEAERGRARKARRTRSAATLG